ncbi:hypothetical protein KBD45_05010 [Candidatus Dojkabacteria bacterium]|nr:hypothetical protein [Candidatus Dojkabacteria bacterium]
MAKIKAKTKKVKTKLPSKQVVQKTQSTSSYPVTITTVLVAVLFTLTVLYAVENFIWA